MRSSDGIAIIAKKRAMLLESFDVRLHLRNSISILTKFGLLVGVMLHASNVPARSRRASGESIKRGAVGLVQASGHTIAVFPRLAEKRKVTIPRKGARQTNTD